ncbi:hypothetical protein BgiBS90_025644, partial [Biomphalaria glabrata]
TSSSECVRVCCIHLVQHSSRPKTNTMLLLQSAPATTPSRIPKMERKRKADDSDEDGN